MALTTMPTWLKAQIAGPTLRSRATLLLCALLGLLLVGGTPAVLRPAMARLLPPAQNQAPLAPAEEEESQAEKETAAAAASRRTSRKYLRQAFCWVQQRHGGAFCHHLPGKSLRTPDRSTGHALLRDGLHLPLRC
jgi:hypothetical protein